MLILRFNNSNAHRYASIPLINDTEFSNSIKIKLRDTSTRLKNEIVKWGDFGCATALTLDIIESRHNIFHAEIEQTISEVLLKRGDFSLVGELGS